MRSLVLGLRTLVLPWGAPPGTPRVIFGLTGADIPAGLVAAYAANGTIIEVDLRYAADGSYTWDGLLIRTVNLRPARIQGVFEVTSGNYWKQVFEFGDTGSSGLVFGATGQNNFSVTVIGDLGLTLSNSLNDDFTINGISQGRGVINRVDSTANSAAVGAETVILTLGSVTTVTGRVYKMRWRGQINHSAAGVVTIRVRRTNIAGTTLDSANYSSAGAQNETQLEEAHFQVTGAGGLETFVLTAQASAGTVSMSGTANNIRYLEIEDWDDNFRYPNVPAI